MTKAESEHMSKVAELGCIACFIDGNHGTPPELHHIRETAGAGQRASNFEVIPLCPAHHRGTMHKPGRDGHVPSIHRDRLAFIELYGSELDLLSAVSDML